MTTVISVRGQKRDQLLADPDFVYVGRAVKWTQWEASIWGNPFFEWQGQLRWDRKRVDQWWLDYHLARGGEASPVSLYSQWIRDNEHLLTRLRRGELAGKKLGCWCGAWKPGDPDIGCHAVVLARHSQERF
jgi:hypothetical protein